MPDGGSLLWDRKHSRLAYPSARAEAVRLPYRRFVKPGVRFLHETIKTIDPVARRAVTEEGAYEADFLVVALGADFDLAATPGLAEGGNEFYSGPKLMGIYYEPSVAGRAHKQEFGASRRTRWFGLRRILRR